MIQDKSEAQLNEELIKWFKKTLDIGIESADEDLVTKGKMDSYTMLLLVNYVVSTYDIELEMENFDYETFRSIGSFARYLVQHQNKSA